MLRPKTTNSSTCLRVGESSGNDNIVYVQLWSVNDVFVDFVLLIIENPSWVRNLASFPSSFEMVWYLVSMYFFPKPRVLPLLSLIMFNLTCTTKWNDLHEIWTALFSELKKVSELYLFCHFCFLKCILYEFMLGRLKTNSQNPY